jgi:hypothetical protein
MPSYETWCDWRGGRDCQRCGGPSAADYCIDCWRDMRGPCAIGPPTTEPKRQDSGLSESLKA